MKTYDVERLDAISATLHRLLNGQLPDLLNISDQHDDEVNQVATFVNRIISDQKLFFQEIHKISIGELSTKIQSTVPVANGLKNLQAAFRHLTWQTKQIAKGDFSQRAEFLGEFSEAFNWMVTELETSQSALESEIEERRKIEEKLRKSYVQMELLIEERTKELKTANASLHNEIKEKTKNDFQSNYPFPL